MPINLGPGELYIAPYGGSDDQFEHLQHVDSFVVGVDQGNGEDFSAITVMSSESRRDVPVSVVENVTFQIDRADSERMRRFFDEAAARIREHFRLPENQLTRDELMRRGELDILQGMSAERITEAMSEVTEIRIPESFRLSAEALEELRSWRSGVSRTNDHIARLAEDLMITGNSFVERDENGELRRVEPQRITRRIFEEMLNLPNRYQRPSAVCERCGGEWALFHGGHMLCSHCLYDDWQKAREEEQKRREAVKPKIQATQYRYIRVKPAKDKRPAKKKTLPRWR